MLGMSLQTFTLFHVIICLIGIASGFVVVIGFLTAKRFNLSTAIFFITNIATSVTGFMFPFTGLKPSYVVGTLALIVLVIGLVARYSKGMAGGWRATYVITSIIALYFNVFVLVVQSFEKVSSLHALAPTQSEPPFAIAQGIVLVLFIVLGVLSVKRFRPV